ncbi:MAG: hypothetical protein KDH09_04585 [Chrysiogenetes bacterium]|nr:hypothetical protein [Chrysiogenetes bacterium]
MAKRLFMAGLALRAALAALLTLNPDEVTRLSSFMASWRYPILAADAYRGALLSGYLYGLIAQSGASLVWLRVPAAVLGALWPVAAWICLRGHLPRRVLPGACWLLALTPFSLASGVLAEEYAFGPIFVILALGLMLDFLQTPEDFPVGKAVATGVLGLLFGGFQILPVLLAMGLGVLWIGRGRLEGRHVRRLALSQLPLLILAAILLGASLWSVPMHRLIMTGMGFPSFRSSPPAVLADLLLNVQIWYWIAEPPAALVLIEWLLGAAVLWLCWRGAKAADLKLPTRQLLVITLALGAVLASIASGLTLGMPVFFPRLYAYLIVPLYLLVAAGWEATRAWSRWAVAAPLGVICLLSAGLLYANQHPAFPRVWSEIAPRLAEELPKDQPTAVHPWNMADYLRTVLQLTGSESPRLSAACKPAELLLEHRTDPESLKQSPEALQRCASQIAAAGSCVLDVTVTSKAFTDREGLLVSVLRESFGYQTRSELEPVYSLLCPGESP